MSKSENKNIDDKKEFRKLCLQGLAASSVILGICIGLLFLPCLQSPSETGFVIFIVAFFSGLILTSYIIFLVISTILATLKHFLLILHKRI